MSATATSPAVAAAEPRALPRHSITVQFATCARHPSAQRLRRWAGAALDTVDSGHCQLCLRLVDEAEMRRLNRRYRQRQGTTNVLAFAAELPSDIPLPLLGDVVLCAPVVWREASQLGRNPSAHWAHLTMHGTLHLLGHDHQHAVEAACMEALEARLLHQLGVAAVDITLLAPTDRRD